MKLWFRKYFIPHKGNNHEPHFLRIESVVVILSVIFVFELAFLVHTILISRGTNFLAAILPSVLVDLTNKSRIENFENSLSENELLAMAASAKAKDMAERGYFSHNTPEGLEPWYWLENAGYRFRHAGENLAVNFIDSKDVLNAWMESAAHRANILGAHFTEIGIAAQKGIYKGREAVFVVQFFGEPSADVGVIVSGSLELATLPSEEIAGVRAYSSESDEDRGLLVFGKDAASVKDKIILSAQEYFSAPRSSLSSIFLVLLGIVFLASTLAVFINVKIQRSSVLVNAAVVLLVISSFLILNQYLALAGARV